MNKRPELQDGIKAIEFKNFYYLKEELVNFCRQNNIPSYGSKVELTERVYLFLDKGIVKSQSSNPVARSVVAKVITPETLIEDNIKCSQKHRAFFEEQLGKSFSFNVAFQKWLKANSVLTYDDACNAYIEIIKNNKNKQTSIDKQFEYNTYIRDFFDSNKDYSLQDAIKCWKHKKSKPGHNRYEQKDLLIL